MWDCVCWHLRFSRPWRVDVFRLGYNAVYISVFEKHSYPSTNPQGVPTRKIKCILGNLLRNDFTSGAKQSQYSGCVRSCWSKGVLLLWHSRFSNRNVTWLKHVFVETRHKWNGFIAFYGITGDVHIFALWDSTHSRWPFTILKLLFEYSCANVTFVRH